MDRGIPQSHQAMKSASLSGNHFVRLLVVYQRFRAFWTRKSLSRQHQIHEITDQSCQPIRQLSDNRIACGVTVSTAPFNLAILPIFE